MLISFEAHSHNRFKWFKRLITRKGFVRGDERSGRERKAGFSDENFALLAFACCFEPKYASYDGLQYQPPSHV